MLRDARTGRWKKVVDKLMSLPMDPLLDALERLRDAGQLHAPGLTLELAGTEHTPQFDAAMLAISNLSTDERLAAQQRAHLITGDELKALQDRKREWLKAGTAASASPVRRWDKKCYGPYSGADVSARSGEPTADPKFGAQKPDEWLSGFLDFYDFSPPPIHDKANTGALFNHRGTTVDEVIDLAYEHWLYSSSKLWIPTFEDEADITSSNTNFFLTRQKIDQLVRKLYEDKRGKAESRSLAFQINWPATYHTNISNAQSGRDSLKMVTAQVGITFQEHHDDEAGPEYQVLAQVQLGRYLNQNKDWHLQQVMVGFQYAWVIPLLEGAAQAQFFGQFLEGLTNLGTKDSGTGAQAAGGVQVSYTIPGTGQHVQLVGVLQGSVTESAPPTGRPSITGDVQGQIGVQVKVYQW